MPASLQEAVASAAAAGRAVLGQGRPADYIPELAKADPSLFAIAAVTVDGVAASAGAVDHRFTLQSVGKVFALAQLLAQGRTDLASLVSVEPSGDAFHSIVLLEEERGRPRNPLINAGAILVSSALPGRSPEEKQSAFQGFLAQCLDADPANATTMFPLDRAVYQSERDTGNRNRGLAYYMAHFGRLTEPDVALDTYFRQCSVQVTTTQLAQLGLLLADGGRTPAGIEVLTAADARRVLALMMTCGLYDQVGEFAIEVGLPAKSGVSGAIVAVAPGQLSVACFSPALGEKGNSVAAKAALSAFSEALDCSLFSPRMPIV